MTDQTPLPSDIDANLQGSPNKTSKVLLIGVIASFAIVTVLYVFITFTQQKEKKVISPSPTVAREAKILYPPKPSNDGRDIYYDIGITYSGSGVYPLIENSKNTFPPSVASATAYIAGNFVKWEAVPNSNDKYLILTGYGRNNANLDIPKIRVGFGKEINLKTELVSGLAVEDLSTILPKILDNSRGTAKYSMGYIVDWQDQLGKIIKPGDVIAVTVFHDPRVKNKKTDLVDSDGIIIAEWVYIRRFNPKETLAKELGREITFKQQ